MAALNQGWKYEVFGEGQSVMIALHGFNNAAGDFRVLLPSLGKKYTIYSFRLPFQNEADDNSTVDAQLTTAELKSMMEQFLERHQINKFSIIGYSLGGRIALQLISDFPGKVESAFLLAPDGLIFERWQKFVVRNKIGTSVYKSILHNPSPFLGMVRLMKKIRLIQPGLAEFIHRSLDTKEKRSLVWKTWAYFNNIHPDIGTVADTINKYTINFHMFFGRHDKVIPPSAGKKISARLDDKNCLHVVEIGHQMIRDKMNEHLIPYVNLK